MMNRAVDLPEPAPQEGGQRLSLAIAEQLKDMILSGALHPGDRLPNEADLCTHFKVSRITLREAIQMLRALGLVEPTRGRGTFVREPDADAVLRDLAYFAFDSAAAVGDLFEVRSLLETTAARRAAAGGGDGRRSALVDLAERGRQMFDEGRGPTAEKLARLDAEFHLGIADLSGNLVLEQLMKRLMQLLEPVRSRSLSVPGQPQLAWDQHRMIAEAIARGNAELAAARVVEHLEGVTHALRSESAT
jgi:GntR family transcriptional repressor for pyruvate dehydrogenase complex